MGRTAALTAATALTVFLGLSALLGYLGSGQDQASEVPLWLRNIETWAGIFQAAITSLAIVVGGLFTYYKFFREDPYSERLQPSLSTTVSRKHGFIFVLATAETENKGQTKVPLDISLTQLGLSVRKAGVYGWHPRIIEEVFVGQDHVRPGETISDQVWLEIPEEDDVVAIQLELGVAAAVEEKEEDLGWITRDIVDLTQIEGNNKDTSARDAESEGD